NSHAGEIPLNDEMSAWLAQHHLNIGSILTADDVIAHGVLYDDVNHYGGFDNSAANVDTNNGITGDIAKPFVELGQTIQSVTGNAFKRDALSDVLPIVQAVMLFFVILFAALIHIFGRYRLGTCISLSFIIFGLIFTNYLWLILDYLENALISSSVTPLSLTSFGEHGVIENFMTMMYFAAPMMLMSLMSITGIKLGSAFNDMMSGSQSQSSNVAKSGEAAIKDVGKGIGGMFK
ncbi:MAG: conjugal transfer protein TraG N-terminal domain-containing protein, partial [Gammaproteobacteria bacterium]